jgi:hypothetical protein
MLAPFVDDMSATPFLRRDAERGQPLHIKAVPPGDPSAPGVTMRGVRTWAIHPGGGQFGVDGSVYTVTFDLVGLPRHPARSLSGLPSSGRLLPPQLWCGPAAGRCRHSRRGSGCSRRRVFPGAFPDLAPLGRVLVGLFSGLAPLGRVLVGL